MTSLKSLPEKQLVDLAQSMMNLDVNYEQLVRSGTIPNTPEVQINRDASREVLKPILEEIKRRSMLVLK